MKGEAFAPVPNRGMITLSIMMANIMQGVDNTILNIALPHVQGSLSASLDQIAWALTSYIVCAAIMMPLSGWLAGRFGIKIIFLVSVIGFTVASTSVRRFRRNFYLTDHRGCCSFERRLPHLAPCPTVPGTALCSDPLICRLLCR